MKKNKILLIVLLLVVCLLSLFLTGCSTRAESKYGTEILKNAEGNSENFMYKNSDELSKSWKLNYSDSMPFSSSSEGGVTIDTASTGYASLSKTVFLKTYSYYKIEYEYNITSMSHFDENSDFYPGLYVGFKEDPLFNVIGDKKAQETSVQSGKRIFYFSTSGTSEYNLTINLGNEKFPVKSVSTVKNISLVRVTEAAAKEGAKNIGLDVLKLRATVLGLSNKTNVVYVILGAVGIAVLALVAYVLRSRDMAFETVEETKNSFYNRLQSSKYLGISIVIVLGLVVRLAVMLTQTILAGGESVSKVFFGYYLENLSAQGTWIAKYGTPYFYQHNGNSTFFPIPLYLSSLAGVIGQGLYGIKGVTANTVALSVVAINKIFAIIADIGAIVILFKLFEKNQGKSAATIMAGLYALLPLTFAMSSAWGAVESVAALLIVSTFYCILQKKYLGMVISYFLACLTSPLSLMFVPATLLYTLFLGIEAIKEKKYKQLLLIVVSIVSSFIVFYLITLPLNLWEIQTGKPFVAFTRFISIVNGENVYTQNAFNFQALLKNNFVNVLLQSKVVDIIFIAFIVIVLAFVYLRTKNRLGLSFIGAGIAALIWTFSIKMKPESLYLISVVLFMVAVTLKDVRVYIGFALYAIFSFINISYVYLMTGYTENGINHISYEGNAMLYVFGAFSLILAIYLIIIGYDVLVNKKTMKQKVILEPYPTHISRVTKNWGISIANAFNILKAWVSEFARATKEDISKSKQKRKEKAQKRKALREDVDMEQELADTNESLENKDLDI